MEIPKSRHHAPAGECLLRRYQGVRWLWDFVVKALTNLNGSNPFLSRSKHLFSPRRLEIPLLDFRQERFKVFDQFSVSLSSSPTPPIVNCCGYLSSEKNGLKTSNPRSTVEAPECHGQRNIIGFARSKSARLAASCRARVTKSWPQAQSAARSQPSQMRAAFRYISRA